MVQVRCRLAWNCDLPFRSAAGDLLLERDEEEEREREREREPEPEREREREEERLLERERGALRRIGGRLQGVEVVSSE